MQRAGLALAASLILLGLAAPASAGKLTVGSGATFDLGTGSLALGCADLDVAGTLLVGTVGVSGARDIAIDQSGVVKGNSGALMLAGDWANSGTFNPGSSTVELVDGCAVASSVVIGDTGFASLSISSATAKQVSFAAGWTQSMIGLSLHGAAGNRLQLRSTVNGIPAFLNLTGTSSVTFIDVQDIDAQAGNDVPIGYNSVKGPNTLGWVFGVPVPMLAPLALGILALLLLATGGRLLPGSTRGDRSL